MRCTEQVSPTMLLSFGWNNMHAARKLAKMTTEADGNDALPSLAGLTDQAAVPRYCAFGA